MRQDVTRKADIVHAAAADAALRGDLLGDLRFRALLPEGDWVKLPPAVRRRFSKRLADGNTAIYVGEVLEIWMSRAGWLVAQAARLIGAPLPTSCDVHVP